MKPLLDLAPSECRWPVTDDKPFLFCGQPQADESSYCACHKRMSTAPEQPTPIRGKALARMADAFSGGRSRTAPSVGVERGREPVDTAIHATLANTTRMRRVAPTYEFSRTAPRRAAE